MLVDNPKKIWREMALCIVAGVLTGTGTAFRFGFNPYAAAAIGGFVGVISFRPKEMLNLCWHFFRENFADLPGIVFMVFSLTLSYFLHRFVAMHIPPTYSSSAGSRICFTYVLGFAALFLVVIVVCGKGWPIPSWKMPLISRIRWFLYWKQSMTGNIAILMSWICVVFFAPVFLFLALLALSIVLVDMVITVAMFITYTPRLAIMWGAAIGTLSGCCFCNELWMAVLFGSAVGVPCGIFFQKLRWHLSCEMDRSPSTVPATP